jgi:hypothetical protein
VKPFETTWKTFVDSQLSKHDEPGFKGGSYYLFREVFMTSFFKALQIVIYAALFLPGCAHHEFRYLDDNLSDRVDLAKAVLGDGVVYFDTSNYGKIAKLNNTADLRSYNENLRITVQSDLVETINQASEGGKLAISGIESEDTFFAVRDAFLSLEKSLSKEMSVLYIGQSRFSARIRKIVEESGAKYYFSKMPATIK